MPGPLITPLINAGTSIFTEGMNALLTSANNRKQRKWNEEMYARQRADALADYNMQNEYNSPRAQMQRLRDANLNPNLVYGHGSATQTAAAPRATNMESWNPQAPQFSATGVGQSLMSYYDIKMKEAQIDNLAAQNTVSVQEALLKAAQIDSITTGTKTSQFDLDMKQTLRETSLEAAKAGVEKLKADTNVQLTANEIAQANKASSIAQAAQNVLNSRLQGDQLRTATQSLQKDVRLKQLDIELKEKGIMPGDPMWARLLARILEKYIDTNGITVPKSWNNVKKYTPQQNKRLDSLFQKHPNLRSRREK